MAYRFGDREQTQLLPQSIEDYVAPDAPVRVYDAFVEALSLKDLGIAYDPHKMGNPEYNPKAMLKLLAYGYSYGIRSSRRLETDVYQFANQIDQANQSLEKPCAIACADAGYANTEEENKIDAEHIQVVVPTNIQAREKEEGPFAKSGFTYDTERNEYRCPEGHPLTYSGFDSANRKHEYRIHAQETCLACPHFGVCTKSRHGRRIKRLPLEEIKLKLEAQYACPEGQAIYKLRKQNAEHPFGHLRRNLGVQYFLMRGRDGVKTETSILATCFNLARMITLIGVPELLNSLLRPSPARA